MGEEEKIEEEDEEEMEVETNLAGKYFVEDLEDFDDENIDMEDFEYPDDSDEQSDDTSVSDEEDEDNDSETSSTDDDDDEESSKPELKPIGKKRSDAIAKKKSSNKKAKIQLEYEEEEEEIEPAQSVRFYLAWHGRNHASIKYNEKKRKSSTMFSFKRTVYICFLVLLDCHFLTSNGFGLKMRRL